MDCCQSMPPLPATTARRHGRPPRPALSDTSCWPYWPDPVIFRRTSELPIDLMFFSYKCIRMNSVNNFNKCIFIAATNNPTWYFCAVIFLFTLFRLWSSFQGNGGFINLMAYIYTPAKHWLLLGASSLINPFSCNFFSKVNYRTVHQQYSILWPPPPHLP
jgi:hypothetical protein